MLAKPKNESQTLNTSHDAWCDESSLGFADGPNKYRYAGNDPVNFRDPSGQRAAGNPLSALRNVVTKTAITALRTFNPLLSTTIDVGIGLGASLINSRPRGLRAATSPVAIQRPKVQPKKFVRQIAPGVPIVPRSIQQLPGVRSALENPRRYQVVNHQGIGNFVIDTKDGGVRFVTGDEYRPIETRLHITREKAKHDAGRARLLTGVQEALITMSPLHEAAREFQISAYGSSYSDPHIIYDFNERLGTFTMMVLPGVDGGKVRFADDFLEEIVRRGNNKQLGRMREYRFQLKAESRFGKQNVLVERQLLDSRGVPVIDPVTGQGRRVDFVIVDDAGNGRYVTEVTSRRQVQTQAKEKQLLKEIRIREAGGVYVRDPQTGLLIDVSNIETRVIGVEPR